MNKKVIVGIVLALAIPVVAYAVSPLFFNKTIDEPLPAGIVSDTPDKVMADKMSDESMMADKMSDESMMADKMSDESMMADKMSDESMMADKADMMASHALSGMFVGVGDGIHDAQGSAKVLTLEDGSRVLRFEDFKSTNGPDLYVYLATDKDASDFVSLGPLKANIGSQNYGIPEGVDLSKYDTALVWCKQFSVLFGSAELS